MESPQADVPEFFDWSSTLRHIDASPFVAELEQQLIDDKKAQFDAGLLSEVDNPNNLKITAQIAPDDVSSNDLYNIQPYDASKSTQTIDNQRLTDKEWLDKISSFLTTTASPSSTAGPQPHPLALPKAGKPSESSPLHSNPFAPPASKSNLSKNFASHDEVTESSQIINDLIKDSKSYFEELQKEQNEQDNALLQAEIDAFVDMADDKVSDEVRNSIEYQQLRQLLQIEAEIKPFVQLENNESFDDNDQHNDTDDDNDDNDDDYDDDDINYDDELEHFPPLFHNPHAVSQENVTADDNSDTTTSSTRQKRKRINREHKHIIRQMTRKITPDPPNQSDFSTETTTEAINKLQKVFNKKDWDFLQQLKRHLRVNICKMFQSDVNDRFRMDLSPSHYLQKRMYQYIADKIDYIRFTEHSHRTDMLHFMFDLRHNLVQLQVREALHLSGENMDESDDDDDNNNEQEDDDDNDTNTDDLILTNRPKRSNKVQKRIKINKPTSRREHDMEDIDASDSDNEMVDKQDAMKIILALAAGTKEELDTDLQQKLRIHVDSMFGTTNQETQLTMTRQSLEKQARHYLRSLHRGNDKQRKGQDMTQTTTAHSSASSSGSDSEHLLQQGTDSDTDNDDVIDETNLTAERLAERSAQARGAGKAPRKFFMQPRTVQSSSSESQSDGENDGDDDDDDDDSNQSLTRRRDRQRRPKTSFFNRLFESVNATPGSPFVLSSDSELDDPSTPSVPSSATSSSGRRRARAVLQALTPEEQLELLSQSERMIPDADDYSQLSPEEIEQHRTAWISSNVSKLQIGEDQIMGCLTSDYEILQFAEMKENGMFTDDWTLQEWVIEEWKMLEPKHFREQMMQREQAAAAAAAAETSASKTGDAGAGDAGNQNKMSQTDNNDTTTTENNSNDVYVEDLALPKYDFSSEITFNEDDVFGPHYVVNDDDTVPTNPEDIQQLTTLMNQLELEAKRVAALEAASSATSKASDITTSQQIQPVATSHASNIQQHEPHVLMSTVTKAQFEEMFIQEDEFGDYLKELQSHADDSTQHVQLDQMDESLSENTSKKPDHQHQYSLDISSLSNALGLSSTTITTTQPKHTTLPSDADFNSIFAKACRDLPSTTTHHTASPIQDSSNLHEYDDNDAIQQALDETHKVRLLSDKMITQTFTAQELERFLKQQNDTNPSSLSSSTTLLHESGDASAVLEHMHNDIQHFKHEWSGDNQDNRGSGSRGENNIASSSSGNTDDKGYPLHDIPPTLKRTQPLFARTQQNRQQLRGDGGAAAVQFSDQLSQPQPQTQQQYQQEQQALQEQQHQKEPQQEREQQPQRPPVDPKLAQALASFAACHEEDDDVLDSPLPIYIDPTYQREVNNTVVMGYMPDQK